MNQIRTSGEENALRGLSMINKRILEHHGRPNCTELNWQTPLTFSSRVQQNQIKTIVKRKGSEVKCNRSESSAE